MRYTFTDFVRSQYTPIPEDFLAPFDLTGKTALVVGASAGIGLASARYLARMRPARLVLACRSQARGEAAVAGECVVIVDSPPFGLCT
jgi:retinol dehydrogenase 12